MRVGTVRTYAAGYLTLYQGQGSGLTAGFSLKNQASIF
jgi:hypothetical protein